MIRGSVNADDEAIIDLVVRGPDDQEQPIEAVVDTGFTGFLTLSPSVINELGLSWRGREYAMLGDGQIYPFDVYAATVIWDGQSRLVETNATDTEPLVGMGLLRGDELRIQITAGGLVTIGALR